MIRINDGMDSEIEVLRDCSVETLKDEEPEIIENKVAAQDGSAAEGTPEKQAEAEGNTANAENAGQDNAAAGVEASEDGPEKALKNGNNQENEESQENDNSQENEENRENEENAPEFGPAGTKEVKTDKENAPFGPNAGEGKPEKKERKLKWARKDKNKEEAGESQEASQSEADNKPDPLAEANNKYARLFAEFDNFRKRTDREKTERYDMGARDMVEKILPVLDNFERGFATVAEEDKEDAFVTGMDLVYKQFLKVLEDAGVKPIEAVGQQFNPDLHNAVMHVEDENAGENVIVEEFQKGYTYKDHVIRYSMVKVAN